MDRSDLSRRRYCLSWALIFDYAVPLATSGRTSSTRKLAGKPTISHSLSGCHHQLVFGPVLHRTGKADCPIILAVGNSSNRQRWH